MSVSINNAVVRNGRLGEKWLASVTAKQAEAILHHAGSQHGLESSDLAAYVASGDLDHLDDATHLKLRAIVKACQEGAVSDSAARRFWPRKVASVLLVSLHPDREVPEPDKPESSDEPKPDDEKPSSDES